MRPCLLTLLIPLGLTGCISFSSSNPPSPAPYTVVLPPGARVVCASGYPPPCP